MNTSSSIHHIISSEPLPVASDYTSNRLDFSRLDGKLYDRSIQESELVQAYHRLLNIPLDHDRQPEFILISGPSGVGKTSLAHTLKTQVRQDGGLFISGKFEQVQRPEPYAPLVAAFTELINVTLKMEADSVTQMKESINRAVDGDGRFLADMIPGLERLIGDQGEAADMHSSEYLTHFRHAFRRFARAVCSPDHPVVLFIDDLQWADPSSLDLIYSLITDADNRGLVVVGSCRDNVAHDSQLSQTLRQLEDEEVVITNIGVGNLKEKSVNELLVDLLDLDMDKTKPLAEVVFHNTNGNTFFVLEFLKYLESEGFLFVDLSNKEWSWDEEKILRTMSDSRCSDPVELIDGKLLQLPVPVQDTMKVAACICAKFDETLIECACSMPVAKPLAIALDAGLIDFDPQFEMYMVAHDNIQQAAYSLIPENEKASFHLKIGRNLRESLSNEQLERNVFIVLNQLDRGASLIKEQGEKYGVASLCLVAGNKSIKSSGFRVAAQYLARGISLLGKNCWREEYDLSLELYNSSAEVEYVTANFNRMDDLIFKVFENARCFRDKLRAYSTQVYSLGVRDERKKAIDTGFFVLRELGEPIPLKVRRAYLINDITKTKLLLRRKTDESLMRLPRMCDPDKTAAMNMLSLLFRSSYAARPEVVPLIITRMVQLSLRYGVCAVSSFGFAEYGILLCGWGDVDSGFRYGQLALSLLARFNTKEWLPSVYTAVYGGINHWKKSFSLSLTPLKTAHKLGLETGDIETSMLAINLYHYFSVHCDTSLLVLEKEVRSNYKSMVAYKQEGAITTTRPLWQMILNLIGKSESPLILTGEAYNEEKGIEDALAKNKSAHLLLIHFMKMVLAYLFGDFVLAGKMAKGCKDAERRVVGSHIVALVSFFHGMSVLALAKTSKHKQKYMLVASQCIRKMNRFALDSPHNYLGHHSLLEAEYAAVSGKEKLAHTKFTCAIALSENQGLLLDSSLANERTGRYLIACGKDSLAAPYIKQACLMYKKWGAHAKVEQLSGELSFLEGVSNEMSACCR